MESDQIIVVEGRADVINLLRAGIKNAVAVEGTRVPPLVVDLCGTKTATAFLDGDRGGELILRALLQVADIDYVAFCPRGKSVEDISRKEIAKALRNRVPVEYVRDQFGEQESPKTEAEEVSMTTGPPEEPKARPSPQSLRGHMEEVKNRMIARFLSPDFSIVHEAKADDVEKILETVNGDVAGVVVDRVVDQKLLDLFVARGMEFLAAPDFRGIVKRPLSIKLLKIR